MEANFLIIVGIKAGKFHPALSRGINFRILNDLDKIQSCRQVWKSLGRAANRELNKNNAAWRTRKHPWETSVELGHLSPDPPEPTETSRTPPQVTQPGLSHLQNSVPGFSCFEAQSRPRNEPLRPFFGDSEVAHNGSDGDVNSTAVARYFIHTIKSGQFHLTRLNKEVRDRNPDYSFNGINRINQKFTVTFFKR